MVKKAARERGQACAGSAAQMTISKQIVHRRGKAKLCRCHRLGRRGNPQLGLAQRRRSGDHSHHALAGKKAKAKAKEKARVAKEIQKEKEKTPWEKYRCKWDILEVGMALVQIGTILEATWDYLQSIQAMKI